MLGKTIRSCRNTYNFVVFGRIADVSPAASRRRTDNGSFYLVRWRKLYLLSGMSLFTEISPFDHLQVR